MWVASAWDAGVLWGIIGVVNFYWFSCWSLLLGVLFVG